MSQRYEVRSDQAQVRKIKHVVGVISGKGGVGKSTVTGVLAVQLRKLGYKVGVLDGDITGLPCPDSLVWKRKRRDTPPPT